MTVVAKVGARVIRLMSVEKRAELAPSLLVLYRSFFYLPYTTSGFSLHVCGTQRRKFNEDSHVG